MADTQEKDTSPSRKRLEEAREKLYQAAESVQERAGRMAGSAGRGASKAGSAIQGGARRGFATAAEKLEDGYDRVSRDWDRKSAGLAESVRENPGRALVAAAGLGFVLGLIFRKRGS